MRKALLILPFVVAMPVMAATDAWVTTDRLNRRTCPATTCGVVGFSMFREKAVIHEEKNGWARITDYYDASCRNGLSEYVDTGNAACIVDNGIVDGRFAEWVSVQYLNTTRPDDPGSGATGDYALISGSDDYRIYKDMFAATAAELMASGQCNEEDIKNTGGWVKSTTTHRNSPVYFIYCGGMTVQNRLYLNAATGEVFK